MKKLLKKENIKLMLAGSLIGAINGFFGGGGGIVAVAIMKKYGIEAKKAHASSVACMLLLCIVSGAVYFFKKEVAFVDVLPFIPGGLAGAFFGTKLLKKVKNGKLELVFALILIFMGVKMLNA